MRHLLAFLILLINTAVIGQRVPVLNQVDLPHNYYYRELYLPQLTGGPSSVAWTPDGSTLVYSMSGSLWLQKTASDIAEQLTDGSGYDYQPDCSPDGTKIIFVRYTGNSIELMLYDLKTKVTIPLTNNSALNLEPRWSNDGRTIAFVSTIESKHFLLYKAVIENNALSELTCLTPDRKSSVKRYYYSAFDHAINPAWHPDGKRLYFVSNNEIIHGTGDIVAFDTDSLSYPKTILHEETSWRTKPDVSPDGSRLVYSSYLGRNWQQLWMIPATGGYPMPLTYGNYDNTCPRWSPDGKKIAFISNRTGNTSLWMLDVFDGGQEQIIAKTRLYLTPHSNLFIKVLDEFGKPVSSRCSIIDEREKFYAPEDAWIHADDSRYPDKHQFESHYFHMQGFCKVEVPSGRIKVQVSHGPEYEIEKKDLVIRQDARDTVIIQLRKLGLPENFGAWWSTDVHVHMNYGGNYRNTPGNLVRQAMAEDLDILYNLIVNKEQRIPDADYFSNTADTASDDEVLLFHGQEFHTSYWGHLGLLELNDHLILPDYAGYPQTAVSSLFPHNAYIADRAHEQQALVGYVHPFEPSEIFPDQSPALMNELPVDAALGKVDYYELIGFSDHKASEFVWYHLLNCGFRIPAAAGTDAMANYASLRGPVGLNRVYVNSSGLHNRQEVLSGLKKGNSFVTNAPLIGFNVSGVQAGESIMLTGKNETTLAFSAFLRSAIPVDHLEIVWNGEVIKTLSIEASGKIADIKGNIKIKGPGWLLLRAWSKEAHPDLPDIYPYASTNPIYVTVPGKEVHAKTSATYFLKWLDRLAAAVGNNTGFRTGEEKSMIEATISRARKVYEEIYRDSNLP